MTFADISIFSKVAMFLLVLVSVSLCVVAYVCFCLRRAAFSLLHHFGTAVLLSLILSQYGVLLKADSLKVSQGLLVCCVCAVCLLSLLYLVLLLYVCHRIQSCFAQFLLLAAIVLLALWPFFLSLALSFHFLTTILNLVQDIWLNVWHLFHHFTVLSDAY